ncbi:MAG: SBBP repeat-containing protein, partial [Aquificaceae bacterium]
GIAIDSSGNVYVAGGTHSDDFPNTNGGAQSNSSGGWDAFVAKLNSGLTNITQATYLGGSDWDLANAIAIDSSGNVYVAGWTNSTNSPGTSGGAQSSNNGSADAFVAKFTGDLRGGGGSGGGGGGNGGTGGGGGGGSPPEETSPSPPQPPPEEPPPPDNVVELPIPVGEETLPITLEVPEGSAKITEAAYVPPSECPTPSPYEPIYGGVRATIEPSSTLSGLGYLLPKQGEKLFTLLTITYPRQLSLNSKVFACTRSGCVDISSLSTISGDKLTVKVEDGSLLDEDGVVNGVVKTRSIVYSVMPQEYRKSGGCSMGSSKNLSLLSLLLLPLLILLRRRRESL